MASDAKQKKQIRDIVLTHAHLDHIAGLPLFVDDLFAKLQEPIQVFAAPEVIEVLENHIFNWKVYPKFSELENQNGAVLRYQPFSAETAFAVKHLRFKAIAVNHKVPAVGFIVSDKHSTFAVTGDTSSTDDFWQTLNKELFLNALLVECAFPDEMEELARASHHLTPAKLKRELTKFSHPNCPIYVINIKPMYYEEVVRQIENLKIKNLEVLVVGKNYQF